MIYVAAYLAVGIIITAICTGINMNMCKVLDLNYGDIEIKWYNYICSVVFWELEIYWVYENFRRARMLKNIAKQKAKINEILKTYEGAV